MRWWKSHAKERLNACSTPPSASHPPPLLGEELALQSLVTLDYVIENT